MRLAPLLVLLATLVAGCAGPAHSSRPAPVRTVEVSGRLVTAYNGRSPEGVYGLRVYLLFRRSDGSGWDRVWTPPGPLRRHRQFDVLDETGAFRFAFATAHDLSAYDEVAVVGAMETETVRLVPAPRGARRLQTSGGPVTLFPLADALRQPVPPEGPITVSGLLAELRPEIGVPVRYAELAREFVHARYGGAPPFELPPVRVELSRSGGNVFQAFDPDALGGTEIELNVAGPVSATIVAHEYGHYVSYRMWGADWWRYTLRNKSLREGWAIFFSFAARNYTAQTYGDVDLGPSNPERAPFSHLLRTGRRYDGISYGTSHPDYAAIGALLWSLYDGAAPSAFEYEPPSALYGYGLAGDNDDVDGLALALFETVRQSRASVLDEAGIAEVVRRLQAEAPEALAASVDGAFSFFLCPAFPHCDYKAPPSEAPATGSRTLRPAAPAALAARRLGPDAVEFTWSRRVTEAPWGNAPDAYHLTRDGTLVATVGGRASSYVYRNAAGVEGIYEVRAIGGGGASYGGAAVRVEPPAAVTE